MLDSYRFYVYNWNSFKALFHSDNAFLWGRNGFDGDKEAMVAYRVPQTRKTADINIIADDYNYALAA